MTPHTFFFFFGGLRPILSRMVYDCIAILGLLYATVTPPISSSRTQSTTATFVSSKTPKRSFSSPASSPCLSVTSNSVITTATSSVSAASSSSSASSHHDCNHEEEQEAQEEKENPYFSSDSSSLFSLEKACNKYCCYLNGGWVVLMGSLLLTVASAGNFTNRWTLTFPMIPLILLQTCRRLLFSTTSQQQKQEQQWSKHQSTNRKNTTVQIVLLGLIQGGSFLCIALAIVLCMAFPAVQLPPISGPYQVGFRDVWIPSSAGHSTQFNLIPVRILYPTMIRQEKTTNTDTNTFRSFLPSLSISALSPPPPSQPPFLLNPSTAADYCRETMRLGAPPPLQSLGWMLHTWRLIRVPSLQPNATLAKEEASIHNSDNKKKNDQQQCNYQKPPQDQQPSADHSSFPTTTKKFPLILFSHGLGGNSDIYTYQTASLAAHGNIVVVLNHLDGSSPFLRLAVDGNTSASTTDLVHNYSMVELERNPDLQAQAQALEIRRNQTNHRVQEIIAVTQAMLRYNNNQNQNHRTTTFAAAADDDEQWLSQFFSNRIHVSHPSYPVTVMGHSFGGATALTAAHRRPDLFQAVIAHEPALGWIPDDVRRPMFLDPQRTGGNGTNNTLKWAPTVVPKLFGGSRNATVQEQEEELQRQVQRYLQEQEEGTTKFHFNDHQLDTLFLFSHEWKMGNIASCRVVEEMVQEGRLSSSTNKEANAVIRFAFIDGAHHNEFSDTSMLTPLWLARGAGMTGQRNPLETAKEIKERTLSFLQEIRRQERHDIRHNIMPNTCSVASISESEDKQMV